MRVDDGPVEVDLSRELIEIRNARPEGGQQPQLWGVRREIDLRVMLRHK